MGRVNANRGDSHDPCLGIDPLEGRRLQECEWLPFDLTCFGRHGVRDFPRQPQHIERACNFQDCIEDRKGLENLQEDNANHEDHERVPDTDAKHMGQGAPQSVIGPRCHQHQVVWSRRDRGRECKADEAEDQCRCHRATIVAISRNVIAKLCEIDLLLQLMTDIDLINDRILRTLSRDGRISNLMLAEAVGLSPSACLRRVQELERTGVIKGYRARLDPAQTGRAYVVYVAVGLAEHTKAAQMGFERAMLAASEVVECHNVAGTFEYMLRVEVADLPAYKAFHTDTLGTVPFVRAITSYMVMGSPKDLRA